MIHTKTAPIQIAFRSNPSRYSFAGDARLLNAYAEKQGNDAKGPLAVLACPGMVSCVTVTDTPSRGNIFLDDLDCGYTIHASGVFKYTKVSDNPLTLTSTRIGTLPGSDQVQLSRNQADPVQISIHCAAGEYFISADVVQKVTATALPTAVTSEYVGGFTVYGISDGRFFFSSINNCNAVDSLDFATAEQYADKLTRIKAQGSDMFIFSHTSIEPWRRIGDIDLPFQLIGGAVSHKGLVAPDSVVSQDNTLMFPGEDNIFYRFQGYAPTRISTHGIERFLEDDADRETIQSLAYSFEGHSFANWTSTDYSVSYDAATQAWHERQSYGLSNWRACNAVRAWGRTIVGDTASGDLFFFDGDTYDEGGDFMVWGMDTPFIHAVGGNGGIVDSLTIDIATGGGALNTTDEGYDPILMLSWSTDGGATFQGNRELRLGKRGDYKKVRARRIGSFADKGIMFRLRISDPVIRGIVGIDANIRPLLTT